MYTLIEIYWNPIGICTTLLTFYRMRKFLNWRIILSWIPFGSDLDPNHFCKCREREETGACTSFRENQSASADRGVCVCVCVCVFVCVFFLNFVIFLTLRFQSFVCRSSQKNSERTRCPWVTVWKSKPAFARESVLVFWSKRKCSDSSVVRDEWTFTTCKYIE